MSFKIQIENFEGPIDALLQMIEKRKMPISDISLANITDDYIRFVGSLESESLSNRTHFIFVASTLTLIKSKSLLPNLELTDEEEGDIEDLKRRIELFKQFQNAAILLKSHFHPRKKFYYAKARKREIVFTPHAEMTPTHLQSALFSVFQELPKKETTKKEASIRIAVHIDEMMDSLESRIQKLVTTNFDSFIKTQIGDKNEPKAVRVYKVVGFLAMLELVKNGALQVLQQENFSSINLESIKPE